MAVKRINSVLFSGLLAAHALPIWAQSAPGNLDLSSTDRTIVADQGGHTITIGGDSRAINAGDLLTPAEYVALTQVMAQNGQQSIVLAGTGNAVGGSLVLSNGLSTNLSSLTIPQSVSVIQNFALGSLNISGNITNAGSFYALSTNAGVSTASIQAVNIFNQPGAVLTSVLPSGGLAGFSDAISNLNLSLFAQQTIANSGIISSSGSLTMTATSIVNALPAGVTGAMPIMQALGDINLVTSQITNAGLVNSLAGNINVSSIMAQNIVMNSAGGRYEALQGLINVRDASFAEKFHLNITGGDFLAKELNLYSGDGLVNIAVNDVVGMVNVYAGELAISASTTTLHMGNIVLTGDPIITNDAGDVIIQPDSGSTFATNGGPLTVIASGNILSEAAIIDTSGGQIKMTAGGSIDLSQTLLLNSLNSAGLGGSIEMTAGGTIFLNPYSTVSGGEITLTAPGGITVGSLATSGGAVIIQAGGVISSGVDTEGMPLGGNTSITTQGGHIIMTAAAIDLARCSLIDTTSSRRSGGSINLTTQIGAVNLAPLGTIQSNNYIYITAQDSIQTGSLFTPGASVALTAGTTIKTGSIDTSYSGIGGAVDIQVNTLVDTADPFSIGADTANGVNGMIKTSGGSQSGFLFVANYGSGGIVIADPAQINVDSPGVAGQIALQAAAGDITISSGTLSSQGGAASGQIFLSGGSINLNDASISVSSSSGAGGAVLTSSNQFSYMGNSRIAADGANGYGLIQMMGADSFSSLATIFDPATGNHFLSASGGPSGNPLTVAGSGALSLSATGTGSGGTIQFAAGDLNFSGGTVTADVSGRSAGYGGAIYIDANSLTNTTAGGINLLADAAGDYAGGFIGITVLNGDIAIGTGSQQIAASAKGGETGGAGGAIDIAAGGSINVDPPALAFAPRADGDGGFLRMQAGLNGIGGLNFTGSGNLNGDGIGIGNGGVIWLSSLGAAAPISFAGDGITVSAKGGSQGSGGLIVAEAGGNIQVDNTNISADGQGGGSGGSIYLSAGLAGSGTIDINGSVSARGSGTGAGGQISLEYGGGQAMTIGHAAGTSADPNNQLSVDAQDGAAGIISISNRTGGDVSAAVNMRISAEANDPAADGSIYLDQVGSVSLSGPGSIRANIEGFTGALDVNVSGSGTEIGLGDLTSTDSVSIKASAADAALVLLDGATLQAANNVVLAAPLVVLGSASKVVLEQAGLVKIESGAAGNDLTLVLPGGGSAAVSAGGGGIRPASILIGPTGGGNLTIASSGGAASLDITGATVSLTTSDGNINVQPDVAISTDAFDATLNFALDVSSGAGDINLSGDLQASQISLSTGGGSIVLAHDLTSPDISISVAGAGTITQTSGSVGIGSLVLSSELGSIGSLANPLKTNVLEIKVNSTADVFIDNASSVDLKTSTVFGALNLNAAGDIAFESAVSAHSLTADAAGAISIFAGVSGRDDLTLRMQSGGLTIAAAGSATSTGDISISGNGPLVLDGNIESFSGTVSVTGQQALSLSGSGSIKVGSNSSIDVTAASIEFGSSFAFGAGSNSSVNLQTAAGGSVLLGQSSTDTLSVTGGGNLNIVASTLSIGNGSGIVVAATSGTALSVSSDSALLVLLPSISGGSLASSGGAITFASGAGQNITFDNGGQLLDTDLSVSGGAFVTTTSNADTIFNGVNVVSDNSIEVNVHNGTLALGGDLQSSGNNATIALLDPAGITIAGTGKVGFIGGASGTIIASATGTGTLALSGSHLFDAGAAGTVKFSSENAVSFADGSSTTIRAANFVIDSPTTSFGSGSSLDTSGAAMLLTSSQPGALTVVLPNGGQAELSGSGSITVATAAGSPITFTTASAGTLAISGADLLVTTENADVRIDSGVTISSDRNVTVVNPGGLFINNGTIDAGDNTFTLTAAGALLVDQAITADRVLITTTAGNGTITLDADITALSTMRISAHGSGNIVQLSGKLTAKELVLESASGSIGSKDVPILFSAERVEVNTTGSAHLLSAGATSLGASSVGALNLSSTGTIAVAGVVSAESISLSSQQDIVGGAGALNTGTLAIKAAGSVGTSDKTLNINAASLEVKAGGSSRIFEADSLILDKVTVGGGLSLSAGGSLVVDQVKAKDGDVSLISQGSILIRSHGDVRTSQGSILIQSNDTAGGTITLSEHSKVDAFSHVLGSGNVTIAVGPVSAAAGKTPGGVKVHEKDGGKVFFGTNGIAVSGKNNKIEAFAANVTFSSSRSGAIQLLGHVHIKADPPVPAASVGQTPQTALTINSSALPSILSVLPGSAGLDRSGGLILPNTIAPPIVAPVRKQAKAEPAEKLRPIAHIVSTAPLAVADHSDEVLSWCEGGSLVKQDDCFRLSADATLLAPKQKHTFHIGGERISAQPGSVILVLAEEDGYAIYNLYDRSSNAVKVQLADSTHDINLAPGECLVVGSERAACKAAVRRSEVFPLPDGRQVRRAEISLLSLVANNKLLTHLFRSKGKVERETAAKILKTGACLSIVTASHGVFKQND